VSTNWLLSGLGLLLSYLPNKPPQLVSVLKTNKPLFNFPIFYGEEHRDGSDVVVEGQLGVFIDVNFGENHLPVGLCYDVLQARREGFARVTPRGKEVDYHWLLAVFHSLIEVFEVVHFEGLPLGRTRVETGPVEFCR